MLRSKNIACEKDDFIGPSSAGGYYLCHNVVVHNVTDHDIEDYDIECTDQKTTLSTLESDILDEILECHDLTQKSFIDKYTGLPGRGRSSVVRAIAMLKDRDLIRTNDDCHYEICH
ncbi:MAG: hypothetical protein HRU15_16700 [Planctomycetes bacterium]|nr:hypothetical protein [Planctomycetota bacterium]